MSDKEKFELNNLALATARRALCEADGFDPDSYLATRKGTQARYERMARAAVEAYLVCSGIGPTAISSNWLRAVVQVIENYHRTRVWLHESEARAVSQACSEIVDDITELCASDERAKRQDPKELGAKHESPKGAPNRQREGRSE